MDMSPTTKTYLWLTVIALCASACRWQDIVYTVEGKTRWGMLLFQIPIAFGTAVVGNAMVPVVIYYFPYAGNFVAEGLTGVLSFIGPLLFTRVTDTALNVAKSRLGKKDEVK